MVFGNQPQLVGAAWGSEVIKESDIGVIVVGPFFWSVIFILDGFNRTDWFACSAVNALIRVDI